MVILRESPRKPGEFPLTHQVFGEYSFFPAATADQQWPPRSPLAAMLSSPSGRKRLQSRSQRNSLSPSPTKRRRIEQEASDEEDEDEETLRLKLQAIEAKLKLKKLQRAKEKSSIKGDDSSEPSSSRPGTSTSFRHHDVEPSPKVYVPLSPIRTKRPTEPTSPARVLLGIDKGLRAHQVSLKRAATTRTGASARLNGSQLSRSNSINTPKPQSFAERMLHSRNSQREKDERAERVNQSRSQGFGLGVTKESEPRPTSRGLFGTSSRSTDISRASTQTPKPDLKQPTRSSTTRDQEKNNQSVASDAKPREEGVLEPYSGFHIKNRKIDHTTLTRTFQGKAVYSIPQLLKEVKSPEYDPPDCESDYVLIGMIASKSSPLEHKNRPKTVHSAGSDEQPSHTKFMVIHLTDLKWELDLFLFGTGFETFWTMTPGTVVAILNPGIMPPKVNATGAFSLKLASSEDTILEIGTSTDLGFCKAVKRDGKECMAWIDARKTEFCEFHISLKVEKARKGRMEFNSMVGGKTVSTTLSKRRGGRFGGRFTDNGLKPEGRTYDRALHEPMYIAPKEMGFNATRLLDDNDADVNAWQRGCSKEEWTRKREKKQAKEAELARKLGELGSGAGSDYLKARQPATPGGAVPSSSTSTLVEHDALSLGLLGKKAEDVTFAAAAGSKRKRIAGSNTAPIGWGGANKRGLLLENATPSLKSTLKEPGQVSPKKSARFMLDKKGIRLPGRESLGANIASERRQNDDSDDDLEIV